VSGHPVLRTVGRLALIVLASGVFAFSINTFVRPGELIPGGFTGVSILTQAAFREFFGIEVPFSLVLYLLNAVPAAICFKTVGKRFTIYSLLMVVLSGLLTDLMPRLFDSPVTLDNRLLSAVFGGILVGGSTIMCLLADATSGGTDFIAISVSEKYNRDAWNYIFAGNCVILIVAGGLFSLEMALYSIIFQFATTAVLNGLYRGYQQQTMFIVTGRPDEVYDLIREKTNHAATSLSGTGLYGREERTLLYSVVYSAEVSPLIRAIRAVDPGAFINVVKTEQINGKFFRKPKD